MNVTSKSLLINDDRAYIDDATPPKFMEPATPVHLVNIRQKFIELLLK